MSVKLEALSDPYPSSVKASVGLIPFSDYSRWERRPIRRPSRPKAALLLWSKQQLQSVHSELSRAERGKAIPSNNTIKAKLSIRSQEPTKIKVLKNEVGTKRESLEAYQAYVRDLLDDNMSLINTIMDMEERTYSSVDRILDRYKHFKGAMQTLKMKSKELIDEATQDLEETRNCLHQDTETQRAKIMEVDQSIEETTRQLQGLRHYKDKEHPVRQVKIEQLKETQEERRVNQIADREELEIQILEEREHYDHHIRAMGAELQARATEVQLATARKSVKARAMQNKIMEKEIIIHQRSKQELLEAIGGLKSAILAMRRETHDHRMARRRSKCLPDTEFSLNFPKQEGLIV